MPAAAVIHEWQALFVLIGCIGYVGGKKSYKTLNHFWVFYKTFYLIFIVVYKIYKLVVKCCEFISIFKSESNKLYKNDAEL